jgi:GTP cyclohydrolase I
MEITDRAWRHNSENEALEDDHRTAHSYETPLREDAFVLTETEKVKSIAYHFGEIMNTLGLDLKDDSLKGTPLRVAKMYVQEIFSGLDPAKMPDITLFDNEYAYKEMLIEKDISVFSHCEHHFVPIYGKAHVAYIPSGKVIGLSKLNRIVQYFSKRPQVQERLTVQIGKALQQILQTKDVAVRIEASHMCVSMRGVQDTGSSTISSFYEGKFRENMMRNEFLRSL